jgi:acyl-coenzyme A thioesterase PaaI-like protein
VPDTEGHGHCGRVAPHGLKGRTQLAIESHDHKSRKSQLQNLEFLYLEAPGNELIDPGISVSEGETDIMIPLPAELLSAGGNTLSTLCFRVMNDSAYYAVSSLLGRTSVVTLSFNASLTRALPSGELLARGRFVGMSGNRYLADSILTDSSGTEIGRGEGVFAVHGSGVPAG